MKPLLISASALVATVLPLTASVTINMEFGQLRDNSGLVIQSTSTLYMLVYDDNNDGVLPGGLGADKSLDSSNASAAFLSFAGKTPALGDVIGGDRVLKVGTFDDPDGIASLGLKTSDLSGTDITLTAGRPYAFYWFPGLSTSSIPSTGFNVGGINESVLYTGTGSNSIGTVVPTDGASVTTSILDTGLGGNVADTARFTAIAVPEPASLAVSSILALASLLRRRRS